MKRYRQKLTKIEGLQVEDYLSIQLGDQGFAVSYATVQFFALAPSSHSAEHLRNRRTDWLLTVCVEQQQYPILVGTFQQVMERLKSCVQSQQKAAQILSESDNLDLMLKTANHVGEELAQETAMLNATYNQLMSELRKVKATKTQQLLKLIDDKAPSGKYVLAFEGHPLSKTYSTYREARRAHSRRNVPHVDCSMLREGKTICWWDTSTRTWVYET